MRKFLAGEYDKDLIGKGIFFKDDGLGNKIYNKKDILKMLKIIDPKKQSLSVYQYTLGVTDADFRDRAYVFGSTSFSIGKETKFVIKADGSREVQDFYAEPDKDFDFKSSNPITQIFNWLTEDKIDPSKIGRTVPIEFDGEVTSREILTQADLPRFTVCPAPCKARATPANRSK